MNWIAKGKISVGWQIVLSFIPGVLFWSFFRIKKLRIFTITMVAPVLFVTIIVIPWAMVGPEHMQECLWSNTWWPEEKCTSMDTFFVALLIELVYHGFKTYYIIKWTRRWNENF